MKVTIVCHVEKEEGGDHDVVVDQVAKALKKGGHKVSVLDVHADLMKLRDGLRRRKPDLVFNLMETFGEDEFGAIGVVGVTS